MLWLVAVVLVFAFGVLGVVTACWARARALRAEVEQRFRTLVLDEVPAGQPSWLADSRMARLAELAVEPRARRHLAQLGWSGPGPCAALCAIRLALGGLLFAGVVLLGPFGDAPRTLCSVALAASAVAHVVSACWLSEQARARRERLREDVAVLVPLLHLCFEAGLSLERSLGALTREGRHALPELAGALELTVLRDIRAGQDGGRALLAAARELDSSELRELAALLRQSESCAGALGQPLAELGQRLAEHHRSELQAQASLRSVQLAFVLVCWLVPALLAGVAGTRVLTRFLLPG